MGDEKPRRFAFKQSALSSVADKMWTESKNAFSASNTSKPVVLEKKSLDDVLSKMNGQKKDEDKDAAPAAFVFGSNISSRVVKDDTAPAATEGSAAEAAPAATNLFKISKPADATADAATSDDASARFREESAKEADRLKKEQEKTLASTSIVTVTTGEENDHNIFNTACKMHQYDTVEKRWMEKGLSQIRINQRIEDGVKTYRIVARTHGAQRVVLNGAVFADMLCERVDAKRIKLSATPPDSPTPAVFLVNINHAKTDLTADQFFSTLQDVIGKVKASETSKRKRKAEDDESLPDEKRERSDSLNKPLEKVQIEEKEQKEEKNKADVEEKEQPTEQEGEEEPEKE